MGMLDFRESVVEETRHLDDPRRPVSHTRRPIVPCLPVCQAELSCNKRLKSRGKEETSRMQWRSECGACVGLVRAFVWMFMLPISALGCRQVRCKVTVKSLISLVRNVLALLALHIIRQPVVQLTISFHVHVRDGYHLHRGRCLVVLRNLYNCMCSSVHRLHLAKPYTPPSP